MLYSADAMTTVGTETDFKYFLPRILDRITVEEYRYNPEFVFGKLRYAKLNSSPNGEQVAVTEYLHSFWCRSLGEYPLTLPAFASISDVVSSIGSAGVDLSWYLEQWTRADSSASTWNLADLVCEEAHNLKRAGVLILHSGISCPSRLTSFPDGWCDRKCYVDCKALTCKTSQV